MNLQFLLPRVPGLGIWQIDTGSINSIRNINDNAAMLRAVCERVSWIPLTLTLEPKEVVNPDDGKKKVVRCLNIRHDTGLLEILAAKDKPRVALLIPAPTEDQQPLDEIPDDEVIEGEIVPTTEPKKAAMKVTAEPEQVVDVQTDEIITPEEELEDLFGEKEESGAGAPAEAEKKQPTGAAPAKPKRDPSSIKNFAQLYSVCFEDFKLQPKDALKELGYSSQSDISDTPAECYMKIAAVRN